LPDRSRHRGRRRGHQKAARAGQNLFGRFAGGYLPADFRNRIAACSEVLPRPLPLAAVFSLSAAGLLVAASVDDMSVSGAPDFRTPGYCVFSWPFVALSAAGLLLAASPAARALKPAVRIHSLLVSLAGCGVAGALAHWGGLGIRLRAH
jgi:hypothetical protein